MSEQWIIRLSLRHSHGRREYDRELCVPVQVDRLEMTSPRAVDELRAGLVRFDDAVAMMKRRQIRREVLRQVAAQLAEQMADHIEDAEGWHGPDRFESANRQ